MLSKFSLELGVVSEILISGRRLPLLKIGVRRQFRKCRSSDDIRTQGPTAAVTREATCWHSYRESSYLWLAEPVWLHPTARRGAVKIDVEALLFLNDLRGVGVAFCVNPTDLHRAALSAHICSQRRPHLSIQRASLRPACRLAFYRYSVFYRHYT
jgi:hypothetical protein